jgi:amino acid adenylation domain-containing protein
MPDKAEMKKATNTGTATGQRLIAANQNVKERQYWHKTLAGDWDRVSIPADRLKTCTCAEMEIETGAEEFLFPDSLQKALNNVSGGNHYTQYVIQVAGLILLLSRYTGSTDIVIGMPVYKQERQSGEKREDETQYINTALPIRIRLAETMTVKEYLMEVRQTIQDALRHQDYPVEILAEQLNRTASDGFPLYDTALVHEKIQEKSYLRHQQLNQVFIIENKIEDRIQKKIEDEIEDKKDRNDDGTIRGRVEYNPVKYNASTVRRLIEHWQRLIEQALTDVNRTLNRLEPLSEEEKRQILEHNNRTDGDYPREATAHGMFEAQTDRTPDAVAVEETEGNRSITYRELNKKANRQARRLRTRGLRPGEIAAVMMGNTIEMIASILAVLKAGGIYLPIGTEQPENRVLNMLNDSSAIHVITSENQLKNYSYIRLQGIEQQRLPYIKTPTRPQEMNLDSFQVPDRTLVDYEKYHPYIGQSMVKNSITVQFSRGCIYKCLYCFKIWPDKYAHRTGENLFEEVNMYYKMGIRRFGFTDDLPNFNKKEMGKFYRLVIKNGLKIHMHFPNGIRGDILTPEYIDLLVEAGAITMDLALETASPRLQKLIKKNVNIERLRENVQYIIDKYPHVILGVQIMHGFPTETEEEARASLEYIKSFRWLPFGYMHILKIYPKTAMARLAMEHGITEEQIRRSQDQGYHELPATLHFPENFTRQCQSEYLGDFFLRKERLLSVLPHQKTVLTEDELVQKYNSYLPAQITNYNQLLDYIGIDGNDIKGEFLPEDYGKVEGFREKARRYFPQHQSKPIPTRLLLLDLSQHFTDEGNEMYHVVDPPLGLMYLLTHLNRRFGERIRGEIMKSQVDFDSYEELRTRLMEIKPDIIGVRTLTYFKRFFHKTIALIRQWGYDVPIIAGGPYATSSYDTMLQDPNIDLAVLQEGEHTMTELMEVITANGGNLPNDQQLAEIQGIAYIEGHHKIKQKREIREIHVEEHQQHQCVDSDQNLDIPVTSSDPAYIIYTSGTTGDPKGVVVRHNNLANQLTALKQSLQQNETNRYLMLAATTFDVSIMHIYSALTTGARLYLIPEELKKDPLALWPAIQTKRIDILNIVPAFMKVLLQSLEKKKIRFKYLLVGGDVFDAELYAALKETFDAETIINIYGPTETTINAAFYRCAEQRPGEPIPIGKPMMNYRVYILDSQLRQVPVGAMGEMYIAGEGVAMGYLNRPERTAETFVELPRSLIDKTPRGPNIMYRTGDRVRWLPGGNIEFIGRNDRQVKIRGYRIERGEIEACLRRNDGVKDVEVVARQDKSGDKNLAAYVVPEPGYNLNVKQLKNSLAAELPKYMIPGEIHQLETFPLTPGGKVDVAKLLEETGKGQKGRYVAPANQTEKKLVEIWAEVLEQEPGTLGVETSFFDAGGHSLKATILVSRIHKTFEVRVSLVTLFKNPTVRGLAQYIEKAVQERYTAIQPVPKRESYPLSSAQKRLFFLSQYEEIGTGYNMPVILTVDGVADKERYQEVCRKLIQRHETLRTAFIIEANEPVQRVYEPDEIEWRMQEERLEHGTGKEETMDRMVESVIEAFVRPFKVSEAPLFRAKIVYLPEEQHLLLFDLHHIISDGMSMGVLTGDFARLYEGETLPPLKLQYRDYAAWQQANFKTEHYGNQEAYWRAEYPDAASIPCLSLPTDYPRPELYRFEGDSIHFKLGTEDTAVFKQNCTDNGGTVFMNLLAALYVLLQKYSGQEDIVVGSGVMGRPHVDLMNQVGFFVNMLALRNRPEEDKTVARFQAEVKENCIQAFANQDVQFEALTDRLKLERDSSRNPLFDISFGVLNFEGPREVEKTPEQKPEQSRMKPYKYKYKTNYYDQSYFAQEKDGELHIQLVYSTALFKPSTIEAMSNHYIEIIKQMAAHPEKRIKDIVITHEMVEVTTAIRDDEESQFEF